MKRKLAIALRYFRLAVDSSIISGILVYKFAQIRFIIKRWLIHILDW